MEFYVRERHVTARYREEQLCLLAIGDILDTSTRGCKHAVSFRQILAALNAFPQCAHPRTQRVEVADIAAVLLRPLPSEELSCLEARMHDML